MSTQAEEFFLCRECAAEFEYERRPGTFPLLKRRHSKSKKRWTNQYNRCPLCKGALFETNEALEQERYHKQAEDLQRIEQERRTQGKQAIDILRQTY